MRNERPAGYLKCASCQTFVPGKFQTCIYCKTCEEYFHERCFQTETEHDEGNEDTIEEDPLIPVENLAELDVGEASREEAERLLSVKRPGTFLIRHSKTVNQYVLSSSSRKAEGGLRCDHCKISYTEVAGRAYYSLRPGDGRPSLLAAVEINRRHLRLLYPFHSPTSEDLNYVQHDQVFNDEECASCEELVIQNRKTYTKMILTLMSTTRMTVKTLELKIFCPSLSWLKRWAGVARPHPGTSTTETSRRRRRRSCCATRWRGPSC